ncbi:hypothetical protein [Bacillus tropicus]|uniref:hypothetical protein n=1 Tax=Bacillus tropicus TaxID=2026188 RepID=UPI002DBA93D0|nr:hypothetical protein [Bacillus tropicus]MEC2921371.1 hypothetical protein [Bacillus tropicus]MEC2926602.1 hypothetical protein [Bacillus tropicus]MEC2956194.1 hypothetical protein [Bacillus tropicus]MEC3051506.1 hypothetical protein [Bacillus tropicus]MEC3078089.1 hypothetical protein [Bacillus tropicus]
METHLQQLLSFYEEQISNSKLFSKVKLNVLICLSLIIILFFTIILGGNTFKHYIVITIITITTAFSIARLTYRIEERLGNLKGLKFKKKIGICLDFVVDTKFLITLNDSKSIREEKIIKLRQYFHEKGFYTEAHLKVFMDILEKEYQNRFNISRLSLLISILIPLCTYYIQTIFNFKDAKIDLTNTGHIFMLNFIFIEIAVIMALAYIFASYMLAALKSMFLLVYPVRKYDVLDLTSLVRELYLECYIEENQNKEISAIRGFVETD